MQSLKKTMNYKRLKHETNKIIKNDNQYLLFIVDKEMNGQVVKSHTLGRINEINTLLVLSREISNLRKDFAKAGKLHEYDLVISSLLIEE